jgi:3-polyprenyl-4-hydroxybenzoate decarboxylase
MPVQGSQGWVRPVDGVQTLNVHSHLRHRSLLMTVAAQYSVKVSAASMAAFTWVDDEQRAFHDFRDLVATNSSGNVALMVVPPARE